MSSAILSGVQRVLSYPRVRQRWALPDDVIDQYVLLLRDSGALVDLPDRFPAIVEDPDDDLVLQTAVAGRAQILCIRDHAFLDRKVEQFCLAHGIQVMNDIDLLNELR